MVTSVHVINQASYWAILVIFFALALVSALICVGLMLKHESRKSAVMPLAVFIISLSGLFLINLLTSTS